MHIERSKGRKKIKMSVNVSENITWEGIQVSVLINDTLEREIKSIKYKNYLIRDKWNIKMI